MAIKWALGGGCLDGSGAGGRQHAGGGPASLVPPTSLLQQQQQLQHQLQLQHQQGLSPSSDLQAHKRQVVVDRLRRRMESYRQRQNECQTTERMIESRLCEQNMQDTLALKQRFLETKTRRGGGSGGHQSHGQNKSTNKTVDNLNKLQQKQLLHQQQLHQLNEQQMLSATSQQSVHVQQKFLKRSNEDILLDSSNNSNTSQDTPPLKLQCITNGANMLGGNNGGNTAPSSISGNNNGNTNNSNNNSSNSDNHANNSNQNNANASNNGGSLTKFSVEIVQQLEFTTSAANSQPQQISTNVTVKALTNTSVKSDVVTPAQTPPPSGANNTSSSSTTTQQQKSNPPTPSNIIRSNITTNNNRSGSNNTGVGLDIGTLVECKQEPASDNDFADLDQCAAALEKDQQANGASFPGFPNFGGSGFNSNGENGVGNDDDEIMNSDAFKDLISEISDLNPEFMKDFDFDEKSDLILKQEDNGIPTPGSNCMQNNLVSTNNHGIGPGNGNNLSHGGNLGGNAPSEYGPNNTHFSQQQQQQFMQHNHQQMLMNQQQQLQMMQFLQQQQHGNGNSLPPFQNMKGNQGMNPNLPVHRGGPNSHPSHLFPPNGQNNQINSQGEFPPVVNIKTEVTSSSPAAQTLKQMAEQHQHKFNQAFSPTGPGNNTPGLGNQNIPGSRIMPHNLPRGATASFPPNFHQQFNNNPNAIGNNFNPNVMNPKLNQNQFQNDLIKQELNMCNPIKSGGPNNAGQMPLNQNNLYNKFNNYGQIGGGNPSGQRGPAATSNDFNLPPRFQNGPPPRPSNNNNNGPGLSNSNPMLQINQAQQLHISQGSGNMEGNHLQVSAGQHMNLSGDLKSLINNNSGNNISMGQQQGMFFNNNQQSCVNNDNMNNNNSRTNNMSSNKKNHQFNNSNSNNNNTSSNNSNNINIGQNPQIMQQHQHIGINDSGITTSYTLSQSQTINFSTNNNSNNAGATNNNNNPETNNKRNQNNQNKNSQNQDTKGKQFASEPNKMGLGGNNNPNQTSQCGGALIGPGGSQGGSMGSMGSPQPGVLADFSPAHVKMMQQQQMLNMQHINGGSGIQRPPPPDYKSTAALLSQGPPNGPSPRFPPINNMRRLGTTQQPIPPSGPMMRGAGPHNLYNMMNGPGPGQIPGPGQGGPINSRNSFIRNQQGLLQGNSNRPGFGNVGGSGMMGGNGCPPMGPGPLPGMNNGSNEISQAEWRQLIMSQQQNMNYNSNPSPIRGNPSFQGFGGGPGCQNNGMNFPPDHMMHNRIQQNMNNIPPSSQHQMGNPSMGPGGSIAPGLPQNSLMKMSSGGPNQGNIGSVQSIQQNLMAQQQQTIISQNGSQINSMNITQQQSITLNSSQLNNNNQQNYQQSNNPSTNDFNLDFLENLPSSISDAAAQNFNAQDLLNSLDDGLNLQDIL